MNVDQKIIVACFGASITRGLGSFNWIKELESRPQNNQYRFVNLGVGGDPTYNGLKRLPNVLEVHPQKVIVAFGWNDIILAVFKSTRSFMSLIKKLPEQFTPDGYRQNMIAIVRQFKENNIDDIALVSPSQMGEDSDSLDPVQSELNRRFYEYSQIVKAVSKAEGTAYIPFYEAMNEAIVNSPRRQAFTKFSYRDFYWSAIRQFILGFSLDRVAEENGWEFHVDGLHLNSRGGMILANLVQKYLDK